MLIWLCRFQRSDESKQRRLEKDFNRQIKKDIVTVKADACMLVLWLAFQKTTQYPNSCVSNLSFSQHSQYTSSQAETQRQNCLSKSVARMARWPTSHHHEWWWQGPNLSSSKHTSMTIWGKLHYFCQWYTASIIFLLRNDFLMPSCSSQRSWRFPSRREQTPMVEMQNHIFTGKVRFVALWNLLLIGMLLAKR